MKDRQSLAYLLLQLPVNGQVDSEGVLLGSDAHRGVGDGTNGPSQISNGLGRHLPLLCNTSGELSSVVLDVLDVSLDLGSELLQVLDDRRVDGSGKGRVGLGDDSGLVTDGVEDVLKRCNGSEIRDTSRGSVKGRRYHSPEHHLLPRTGFRVGKEPG